MEANIGLLQVEPACTFIITWELDANGITLTTHILLFPFVIPN